MNVAHDFAESHHVAGMNFGSELGTGADREFMPLEPDGPFHDAVNVQIFGAGDFAFDLHAGAQTRATTRRGAARFS